MAAFAEVLGALEEAGGLAHGALRFELQVETTQSIVDADGLFALPRLVSAAQGRCTAAHFGTYDYTAACGLPASQQRIDHPCCDAARHVMQIALAGRGVRLSDGSTNVLPASEGHEDVHLAWRLHAGRSPLVAHGFFQGWDLAAAQLPSRYAAVYAFHLATFDDTAARIRAWREATPSQGGVLDEPATVKALLASLRRALDCGAVRPAEILERTGAAPAELWPADPPPALPLGGRAGAGGGVRRPVPAGAGPAGPHAVVPAGGRAPAPLGRSSAAGGQYAAGFEGARVDFVAHDDSAT